MEYINIYIYGSTSVRVCVLSNDNISEYLDWNFMPYLDTICNFSYYRYKYLPLKVLATFHVFFKSTPYNDEPRKMCGAPSHRPGSTTCPFMRFPHASVSRTSVYIFSIRFLIVITLQENLYRQNPIFFVPLWVVQEKDHKHRKTR
jgi:hypothetical protein